MDGHRFDDLTRALARPASRRGAIATLAALLPAASAAAAPEGARRRRGCRPKCGDGFSCENRECVCPSGVTCAGACCAAGQACEGGACVTPQPPPVCIPPGQACKGLGRACCDGRTCASGQGGQEDIACWTPAGGACATTAECVYGAACRGGACVDTYTPCTVCADDCPYATIEAALANPDLETIRVGAGTYFPNDGRTERHQLLVNRSVTIEGCGNGPVTIDGAGERGVIYIGSDDGAPMTVTLRNLAIVNGRAAGGGIFNGNTDGDTTLDGVTVAGCVSPVSDGGGIFNVDRSRMVITGSSVIRDNACPQGQGGGILNDALATLRIEGRTVVRGNRANLGGGVYSRATSTLTLAGQASITGNEAGTRGGGVYASAGAVVSCEGAPTVCGNSAQCTPPNCEGALGASCAGVCCAPGGTGRGDVGAAGC